MRFYTCKHCGNIIAMIQDSGVNPVCCGDAMVEYKPNTLEASLEKHIPALKVDGKKVTVSIGSEPHPMLEEHHILWVALETTKGIALKYLHPKEKPEVTFTVSEDDVPLVAYELCNIHGLWKKNF